MPPRLISTFTRAVVAAARAASVAAAMSVTTFGLPNGSSCSASSTTRAARAITSAGGRAAPARASAMARERAAFCSGSARGSLYASVTAVKARASCSANSSARVAELVGGRGDLGDRPGVFGVLRARGVAGDHREQGRALSGVEGGRRAAAGRGFAGGEALQVAPIVWSCIGLPPRARPPCRCAFAEPIGRGAEYRRCRRCRHRWCPGGMCAGSQGLMQRLPSECKKRLSYVVKDQSREILVQQSCEAGSAAPYCHLTAFARRTRESSMRCHGASQVRWQAGPADPGEEPRPPSRR